MNKNSKNNKTKGNKKNNKNYKKKNVMSQSNSSSTKYNKNKQGKRGNGPLPSKKGKNSKEREILELTCYDMTTEGKGIVFRDHDKVLVDGLIKGETAQIEILEKYRKVDGNLKKVVKSSGVRVKPKCPYFGKCGGCQLQHMSYKGQLDFKQQVVEKFLKPFGHVNPIIGMEEPYYYRNKIHATYGLDKNNNTISGFYEERTHRLIEIEQCIIQDEKADKINKTIKKLLRSFKIRPYEEDRDEGFLRHVLIKTGYKTNEVMVVLVASSLMLKGKNNFVKALREAHPEITTIILNENNKPTSMVLGDREKVLYGTGRIKDELCGKIFSISAKSFYQVNPIQTEKLYKKAIQMADFKGNETVLDAYSGIGTIGAILSGQVKSVIGVELNQDAVKDAVNNAKLNQIKNIKFYQGDAGEFIEGMVLDGKKLDVVMMDPPRSGSDEKFLKSVVKMMPKKIVYISCNYETQARDLEYLTAKGYKVEEIQPVDMFAQTNHVETVVKLQR